MPTKDHLLITIDINQNNCNTNALLKTTVAAALGLLPALAADAYVPLVQGGKQWGYVQYLENPCQNRHAYLNYYRLAFSGSKEIDGVTYLKLIKSSNFHIFDNSFSADHCWAYMREEEGKVYVRYNNQANADYLFYDADNTEDITPEFLLYDFNMREGDVLTIPSNREGVSVSLKCVETGQTETLEGYRKYLKFDRYQNLYTDWYMAYDYLVEGVGPIGKCQIWNPYRGEMTTSTDPDFFEQDLLYVRGVEDNAHQPGSSRYHPGEMLFKTAAFEVFGVYDPSVWFWKVSASEDAVASEASDNVDTDLPDPRIMGLPNYLVRLVSLDEPLTQVKVFDMLGRELAEYSPMTTEFQVNDGAGWPDFMVVRATTASGHRSFKISKKSW